MIVIVIIEAKRIIEEIKSLKIQSLHVVIPIDGVELETCSNISAVFFWSCDDEVTSIKCCMDSCEIRLLEAFNSRTNVLHNRIIAHLLTG